MKKILFTIAICLVATANALAQELVITVTHEGTNTYFYGFNAFQAAVNASANGDILTISPGAFNGGTINGKSITIRGNGAEGPDETRFLTEVRINKPAIDDDPGLYIEGINFAANLLLDCVGKNCVSENITIAKCNMLSFGGARRPTSYTDNMGIAKNVTVLQCRVTKETLIYRTSEYYFINSILGNVYYDSYDGSADCHVEFNNCVALLNNYGNLFKTNSYRFSFNANNSILIVNSTNENDAFQNNHVFNDCIVTSTAETRNNLFSVASCLATNCAYYPITSVFKNVTDITQYVDDPYDLISAPYLQNTEGKDIVGAYSGTAPFNLILNYPVIKSVNVSDKAENGIINVSVSVDN